MSHINERIMSVNCLFPFLFRLNNL